MWHVRGERGGRAVCAALFQRLTRHLQRRIATPCHAQLVLRLAPVDAGICFPPRIDNLQEMKKKNMNKKKMKKKKEKEKKEKKNKESSHSKTQGVRAKCEQILIEMRKRLFSFPDTLTGMQMGILAGL